MKKLISLIISLHLGSLVLFAQFTVPSTPTPSPCSPCSGQQNPGGGNVFGPTGNFLYSRPGDTNNYQYRSDGYAYYTNQDGIEVRTTLQDDFIPTPPGSDGGGGESYGYEDDGFDPDTGFDDDRDDGDDGGGDSDPRPPTRPLPQLYDCNGELYGTAYIDACGVCVEGTTGLHSTCTLPPKYYFTLNNYSTKYYNGDTIYVPKGQAIELMVINENGNFDPNGSEWKRNDTSKCSNTNSCRFDINLRGISNIKIDSIGGKILINCPLVVYNPPTIYFQRHNGYNGEYGFDDVMHKYYNVSTIAPYKNGYQVKSIHSDTAYYVPWMSLLDKQFATIKVKKVWNDSLWIVKDINSSLKVIPGQIYIKINNQSSYTIKYADLSSFNDMGIYSEVWDLNTNNLKTISSINVISNLSDTLGKLRLSCTTPKPYRVTYVYVNTGNGYDSSVFKRTTIIDNLNSRSHNQFFRKWSLYTGYPDTLDLTNEYSHNPGAFFPYDSALKTIKKYYKLKKGIDVSFINGPGNPTLHPANKKHIFFLTTLSFTIPTTTYGATEQGWTSGAIFKNANMNSIIHEHGHILNLGHTFDPPFNLPRTVTNNFMDSKSGSLDYRTWFGYFQWKDVF